MLISDWSSYVCSSDLGRHLVIPDIVRHRDRDDGARHHHQGGRYRARRVAARRVGGGRADRGAVRNPDQARISTAAARGDGACGRGPDGGGARLAAAGNLFGRPAVKRRAWPLALLAPLLVGAEKPTLVRSDERRVGKEGVSKCRTRGVP